MITTWGEWKRYPTAARGDKLEAPIGPGIYEVRVAATGALFAFGAVDNVQDLPTFGNGGQRRSYRAGIRWNY